jgi:hypothetical protein
MENSIVITERDNVKDKYYQLNQLMSITGLSQRMLKYRMLKVKDKYKDFKELLFRKSNKWQIHHSIINEFMPLRKKVISLSNSTDWICFVTWNTIENYQIDYHVQLLKLIKEKLPLGTKIKYVIEKDKRGVNHVHFLTNATINETIKCVNQVLYQFFNWYEIMTKVTEINDLDSVQNYLAKAPIKSGEI